MLIDELSEWLDAQIDGDRERHEVRRSHPSPDRIAAQLALGYFLLRLCSSRPGSHYLGLQLDRPRVGLAAAHPSKSISTVPDSLDVNSPLLNIFSQLSSPPSFVPVNVGIAFSTPREVKFKWCFLLSVWVRSSGWPRSLLTQLPSAHKSP